jgi:hypothetical protein
MVCPKVLTTGMPRTYSTASDDMDSSAFWYSFMSAASFGPIIAEPISTKAIAAGIRHISPSRQSNTAITASSAMGVAMETALSGRLCARYVSVAALESETIFRILPVPSLSTYPSGNFIICSIMAIRIFACTRNAAK